MIQETLRRLVAWIRSGLFTLILHGGILYLILFGLDLHQEKLEAKGKPMQAVVIHQQELEQKAEEKKRRQQEQERQRQAQEQQLAEEKKRKEEAARKQEQERQRRQWVLSHCEKLVREEEQSGQPNHELDGLCDQEREALKQLRAEEEQQRRNAERQRKEEEEQKRKAEEEAAKRRQEEQEAQRKAEQERRQAEAEKKRKEEEQQRKAEEERKRQAEEQRLLEERRLKAQLAEERQARLAAETEQAATNALEARAGRIKAAIEDNWRRPAKALLGLQVVIGLRVGRNGEVKEVRIVESSGDTQFDESAEIAVRKASPLPIPEESEYYEYIKEFQINFNPDE